MAKNPKEADITEEIDDLLTDQPNDALRAQFETAALAAESHEQRVTGLVTTDKSLIGQSVPLKYSHPVFELGEFNAVITSEGKIIIE